MTSKFSNTLYLSLGFILLCLIIFNQIQRSTQAEKEILCSKELANFLRTLCNNKFHKRFRRCLHKFSEGPKDRPREGIFLHRAENVLQKLEDAQSEDSLQIGQQKIKGDKGLKHNKGDIGLKILHRYRRQDYHVGKGVVDECCYTACVYDDLRKYCA